MYEKLLIVFYVSNTGKTRAGCFYALNMPSTGLR